MTWVMGLGHARPRIMPRGERTAPADGIIKWRGPVRRLGPRIGFAKRGQAIARGIFSAGAAEQRRHEAEQHSRAYDATHG